jgi:hypothetical protein
MKFSIKISIAVFSIFLILGISANYRSAQSSSLEMPSSYGLEGKIKGEFLFIRQIVGWGPPGSMAYEEEWTLIPFTIYFYSDEFDLLYNKHETYGSSNIGIIEGEAIIDNGICVAYISDLRIPVKHKVSGFFNIANSNRCMFEVTVTEYWPPGEGEMILACPSLGTITSSAKLPKFSWQSGKFKIHAPDYSDTNKFTFRNVKYEDSLILNSIEDMSGLEIDCLDFNNVGNLMKGFDRIMGP